MVKPVTTTKYHAFDGTAFDTKDAALVYEKEGFLSQFVGWKKERVLAAAACDTDKGKADAASIERWGTMLKDARLKRGELWITRKTAKAAPEMKSVVEEAKAA